MYAAIESELAFVLKDFRGSITDAPGHTAYPICEFTWVIVPDTIQNPEKRQKVISFLRWVLTNGQNTPAKLFYGRLPEALVKCELHVVNAIH
jgi:ABC-type phosphate transport system substrate-binding protein